MMLPYQKYNWKKKYKDDKIVLVTIFDKKGKILAYHRIPEASKFSDIDVILNKYPNWYQYKLDNRLIVTRSKKYEILITVKQNVN